MKHNYIHYLSLIMLLALGFCLYAFVFSAAPIYSKSNNDDSKHKGAHVFSRIDTTNFDFLNRNNIEWVTLVAWSNMDDYDSPRVRHHRRDSTNLRRSNERWIRRIKMVQSGGFKVFVKPHVWIHQPTEGMWRSDVFPTNDENWETWKKSYRDYILRYARIAQEADAEMFCVGTEFTRLTIEKPDFWKDLIQEVRTIYSGKVTYAANWYQEFEKIDFWDQLDYIGIQAYFPLTDNEYPSVDQISKGWDRHIPSIESVHKQYDRKILFTEMGYKSTSDSAVKPWEWIETPRDVPKSISNETQANCFEAFFTTIWPKEWLAGVHIWQLRSDDEDYYRANSLDFTPLCKEAENVIARGFE